MTDLIGWAASAILLATLLTQIRKQWKANTREGVSKWLFIGQLATSVLFTTYSALKGDMVFIVTNSLLILSAITGIVIFYRAPK